MEWPNEVEFAGPRSIRGGLGRCRAFANWVSGNTSDGVFRNEDRVFFERLRLPAWGGRAKPEAHAPPSFTNSAMSRRIRKGKGRDGLAE